VTTVAVQGTKRDAQVRNGTWQPTSEEARSMMDVSEVACPAMQGCGNIVGCQRDRFQRPKRPPWATCLAGRGDPGSAGLGEQLMGNQLTESQRLLCAGQLCDDDHINFFAFIASSFRFLANP
jgi:hypothetical protein